MSIISISIITCKCQRLQEKMKTLLMSILYKCGVVPQQLIVLMMILMMILMILFCLLQKKISIMKEFLSVIH